MSEKTMDEARRLIGERKFQNAEKVCRELIRQGTEVPEASVLRAACLCCLGASEKDAKKLERIRSAAAEAYQAAQSPEAVCQAENRLLSAMCRYRGELMEQGVRQQKEKASLPQLKVYFDTGARYEQIPAILKEEAQKYLNGENPEKSPEEALNLKLSGLEHEAARSIFGEARLLVQFHGTGTGKEVGEILRQAVEMTTVAQILAQRSHLIPLEPADRLARLRTEAEILQWGLGCIVHPDGQNLSLFSGGREDMLEKLKTLYDQIRELDPDFAAPQLPSPEGINTIPQKSQKKGFFGKK